MKIQEKDKYHAIYAIQQNFISALKVLRTKKHYHESEEH